MSSALAHRGPDGAGLWQDLDSGIVLGHRRLAILDLSSAGRQPMTSSDGRYVVVFNGEIYNYSDIRDELQSTVMLNLRGRSDTEVLVEAFAAWGIEKTLRRLNGMFAIAAWDRSKRELSLCRDRFGEKPLYYTLQQPWFCFASELKALAAHKDLSLSVDPSVIPSYAASGYVPEGASIYQEVKKLTPGSFLVVSAAPQSAGTSKPVAAYWSAEAAVHRARSQVFVGTQEDALAAVRHRLREAVKIRMAADVPLGSMLSGGIDSSLVTAIMQSASSRPVRTFTVGFPASAHDESAHARAVAGFIGAEHTHVPATEADILRLVPEIPTVYDEPFADSSQLPTLLLSNLARQHVTVALTGDGGDEIFGGYNRYRWALRAARGATSLLALKTGSRLIHLVPDHAWQKIEDWSARALGDRFPFRNVRARSWAAASISRQDSFERRYELLTLNHDLLRSLSGSSPNLASIGGTGPGVAGVGPLHWMMCRDAVTYLPGDILVKVDRAAMARGLETRLPFLDPALADLAWSLPQDLLIRKGRGKWILRKLLGEWLPPKLFQRPKRGFTVPLGVWLRGPLREWAGDLLGASVLSKHNFFRHHSVAAMWKDHLAGRNDLSRSLWPVLMFNAWYIALR